jgi:hypothetical protein
MPNFPMTEPSGFILWTGLLLFNRGFFLDEPVGGSTVQNRFWFTKKYLVRTGQYL